MPDFQSSQKDAALYTSGVKANGNGLPRVVFVFRAVARTTQRYALNHYNNTTCSPVLSTLALGLLGLNLHAECALFSRQPRLKEHAECHTAYSSLLSLSLSLSLSHSASASQPLSLSARSRWEGHRTPEQE